MLRNMPPELKTRSEGIGGIISKAYWDWGQLANDIYAWGLESGEYTMEDCALASIIMVGESYSIQRVMEFANVQSFYAPLIASGQFRDEYLNLPFTIVEYAKSQGKRWSKVLNWVIEQKMNNKPHSLNAAMAKFNPKEEFVIQKPSDYERPNVQSSEASVESSKLTLLNPSFFANTIRSQIRGYQKQSPRKARIMNIIATLLDYLASTPDEEISNTGILQNLQDQIINIE